MGKITDALQKAAKERLERLDKVVKIHDQKQQLVVQRKKDSNVDPRLITYFDPKTTISEQYKSLSTNILSLNKGKPP